MGPLLLLVACPLLVLGAAPCEFPDEESVSARARAAHYVFTAKVASIAAPDGSQVSVLSPGSQNASLQLRIKRLIKGSPPLPGDGVVWATSPLCGRDAIRRQQTAIFLASRVLQLQGSPVPLTLSNLAAVSGDTKYSHDDGTPLNLRERDACLGGCRVGDGPVCGSDGHDYADQCSLRREACRSNASLTLRFRGRCDPCVGVQCLQGAVCRLGAGRRPECRCGGVCSETAPVCASDGLTYSSECAMRQHECRDGGATLRIIYRGHCASGSNPCTAVVCAGPYERCAVNDEGAATCQCPPPCDAVLRPVCGSDGRTYSSSCELRRTACLTRIPVSQATEAACAETVSCTDCQYGSTCVTTNGHSKCTCPHCSSEMIQPVCGSNGITYNSSCSLQADSCNLKVEIFEKYSGPCKTGFLSDSCNSSQEHCPCKPGVSGTKCDECQPGFWGFTHSQQGCQPCGCSELGAMQGECERTTGQCLCKTGVQGRKCSQCANANHVLGVHGCVPEVIGNHLKSEEPSSKSTRHLDPVGQYFYHSYSTQHEVEFMDDESLQYQNDIHYANAYRPTPATVNSFTALIGDLCLTDNDCRVAKTYCEGGGCICMKGFIASRDRQHCIAYHVPAFDGKAYLKLKRLKGYNKLSLEVEFITYSNNGIILYNQQKVDGKGDYVSLAIINGYIQFRYNLGNGPVVINSSEPVSLNEWQHVTARRYHKDGMLRLNNGPEISGQSQGMLKSLDLTDDTYVGFIPTNSSRVFENIGTSKGLLGCVRRLKLGQHDVMLAEGYDTLVLHIQGIQECEKGPCATSPCLHSGTCLATTDKEFQCLCSQNYTGQLCENRIDMCSYNPCVPASTCEVIPQGGFSCVCHEGDSCHKLHIEPNGAFIPEFHGSSNIELPCLEGVSSAFSIEIWFLTRSLNGILLYNGQLENGRGDYIMLKLVDGRVQFQFNLGSGVATIVSQEVILLGQWHSVRASRIGRDGSLQLDDGMVINGYSGPPLNKLDLKLPMYIGGLPFNDVPGLNGAIQRVTINGHVLDNLGEGVEDITQWHGQPCIADICHNGGTCIAELNTYSCKCKSQYFGSNCQHYNSTITIGRELKFTGNTFYQFLNKVDKRRKVERINRYEFEFRTMEMNGLIFWLSKGKSLTTNHFALSIVDGFLHLRFSVGKGYRPLILKSKVFVSDGAWHTVLVNRRHHHIYLKVDKANPIRNIGRSGPYQLRSNGWLWIGGAPNLPLGLPASYYLRFRGCISKIIVSKKLVNISDRVNMKSEIQYCHENDV